MIRKIITSIFSLVSISLMATQHNVVVPTSTNGHYSLLLGAATTSDNDTVNVTLQNQSGFFIDEADVIGRLTITIEGSSFVGVTVIPTGSLTVSGNIDLGTNLTNNGGTLIVGGGFTNTGVLLNLNNSTVEYNGSSAQTISATTYENLTFSGSGQKNIAGNITVNDAMTCNASTINITSGTLTVTTFTAGTSTFEYAASGDQDIIDLGADYFNLVVEGTGTKFLPNTALGVDGDITITSGILKMGGQM